MRKKGDPLGKITCLSKAPRVREKFQDASRHGFGPIEKNNAARETLRWRFSLVDVIVGESGPLY